jgi:diguanylate cyclase (GGDEF)-like protein
MNASAHLLVVSLDVATCQTLQKQLGDKSYKITVAHTREELIHQLTHAPIDLILLCGQLAAEEGEEYCHTIRQLPKATTLPIILASPHLTPEAIERCYQVGADDILPMLHPELLHQHAQLLLQKTSLNTLMNTYHQPQCIGVIAMDSFGTVQYLNATAQTLTGWSLDSAQQQNFSHIFNLIDPVSDTVMVVDLSMKGETIHHAHLQHKQAARRVPIEYIVLPFAAVAAGIVVLFWETTEKHSPKPNHFPAPPNFSASSGGNILVAEDSAWMRMTLKWALEEWDYHVILAEDGDMAVENFKQHPVDLILMDADMPVLNGIDACKQIRELPHGRNVPIVMVTGLDSPQWVDSAYRAGVTDFVSKPIVNWAVLRNRIHYLMTAKRNEDALFDEKERAQITLASIGDGVITTDIHGRVEYLNQVAIHLTGWTVEEAKGLPLNHVFHLIEEPPAQPLSLPLDNFITHSNEDYLSFFAQRFIRKVVNNPILLNRVTQQEFAIEDTIAPIQDRNGTIVGKVLVFRDVTENRNLILELWHRATHDALTNLFNRPAFELQAHTVLHRLEQTKLTENRQHILMYMDLDRFKNVNDTCGYEAGDQLLKNVAYQLQQCLHEGTQLRVTLARLGGDEFGLLIEDSSLTHAESLAQRLRDEVCNYRFLWVNKDNERFVFSIGVSIGLVAIPDQHLSYESLAAMAGDACHHAKNAGGNEIYVYQQNNPNPNLEWVKLIKHNLEHDGFVLFTQRILAMNDTTTQQDCWEFLLRMYGDTQQILKPGSFFSNASRNNLMPAIDRWVIKKVFRWFQLQPSKNIENLGFVTVNISYYSLEDADLLNLIIQHAKHNRLPTEKICFEIDETSLINNFTGTANFIQMLKAFGFKFAIDNFGSGMAAFHYLRNLPIDFIKIDGSLIRNLSRPSTCTIVKAIQEFAHLENVQTIAEWVEHEECLSKLKEIGIDYIQGYWVAAEIQFKPDSSATYYA